jgi:hypothetical protein
MFGFGRRAASNGMSPSFLSPGDRNKMRKDMKLILRAQLLSPLHYPDCQTLYAPPPFLIDILALARQSHSSHTWRLATLLVSLSQRTTTHFEHFPA